MMRVSRAVPASVALAALALIAVGAANAATLPKPPHKHHHYATPAQVTLAQRPLAFPTYVDHGADYNPNGDDLYFNDTKRPHYIVGPAWFQRWDDR